MNNQKTISDIYTIKSKIDKNAASCRRTNGFRELSFGQVAVYVEGLERLQVRWLSYQHISRHIPHWDVYDKKLKHLQTTAKGHLFEQLHLKYKPQGPSIQPAPQSEVTGLTAQLASVSLDPLQNPTLKAEDLQQVPTTIQSVLSTSRGVSSTSDGTTKTPLRQASKYPVTCIYCTENTHLIYTCPTWFNLPNKKKQKWIIRKASCTHCLVPGHCARGCTYQRGILCGKNGCKSYHHITLHPRHEDFHTPNASVSSAIQQTHSMAPKYARSPSHGLSDDLSSVDPVPPRVNHNQCHLELPISGNTDLNLSNSEQVIPIKANEPAPGQIITQHLLPTTAKNLH